ncbi:MAG: hypothetical protein KJ787_14520 [Gammaproteobacteria bacterium]|nr:hypothetical protein [Gammaproteobacteria bacterium]MBU1647544.1 hypothetical protein [Gammaproteobacteria bacterium]MBU1972993.1 hypothetical protein [Gammaproteobacteria bacterium]
MKIHQLPIGARFEFEGEQYVKTGPLFATSKDGQRFFPKYAVLKPLGNAAGEQGMAQSGSLSKATVLAAFEAFYAECSRRLPDDQRTALAGARDRFLKTLG